MKKKALKVIVPLAFWLLLWAIGARWVDKELLLPPPASVGRTLLALLGEGSFWQSVAATLGRITAGFLLGAVLGLALGGATAGWGWCDLLLSPAMKAVRTVPVVSFILLLYFWLPSGRVPVATAALMALPVVWRSTRQGIAAAEPALLEAAEHYRLNLWRKLRLVYLPAAMPALCAGWENALGLAWKAGVAAEVLCQPKWAVGSALQSAKTYLDASALFAWTAAVVALSLAMEALARRLLRPWREEGRG
ncbi:ABC transporter permease [Vermiculatibacterium agrestimuris]|uniref:ABC transporter permease n=1 Tax=Vermiculatibacterium agrestimuris TaxID=2941519 RepID=UPI00203F471A|nr:ABC transporter permease subunit [Vermiculatibacterium agrestimuris]